MDHVLLLDICVFIMNIVFISNDNNMIKSTSLCKLTTSLHYRYTVLHTQTTTFDWSMHLPDIISDLGQCHICVWFLCCPCLFLSFVLSFLPFMMRVHMAGTVWIMGWFVSVGLYQCLHVKTFQIHWFQEREHVFISVHQLINLFCKLIH